MTSKTRILGTLLGYGLGYGLALAQQGPSCNALPAGTLPRDASPAREIHTAHDRQAQAFQPVENSSPVLAADNRLGVLLIEGYEEPAADSLKTRSNNFNRSQSLLHSLDDFRNNIVEVVGSGQKGTCRDSIIAHLKTLGQKVRDEIVIVNFSHGCTQPSEIDDTHALASGVVKQDNFMRLDSGETISAKALYGDIAKAFAEDKALQHKQLTVIHRSCSGAAGADAFSQLPENTQVMVYANPNASSWSRQYSFEYAGMRARKGRKKPQDMIAAIMPPQVAPAESERSWRTGQDVVVASFLAANRGLCKTTPEEQNYPKLFTVNGQPSDTIHLMQDGQQRTFYLAGNYTGVIDPEQDLARMKSERIEPKLLKKAFSRHTEAFLADAERDAILAAYAQLEPDASNAAALSAMDVKTRDGLFTLCLAYRLENPATQMPLVAYALRNGTMAYKPEKDSLRRRADFAETSKATRKPLLLQAEPPQPEPWFNFLHLSP